MRAGVERVELAVDVAVLLSAAGLLVAVSLGAPPALRVPLVLLFVLLAPGAALARALRLRDLLSFLAVAVAASPALLLVLSVASLQLGPLNSRAVVAADLLATVALLVIARLRRPA